MVGLLDVIQKDEDVMCGSPLDLRKAMIYNHNLKEAGLAEVPEDFIALLRQINGIWSDGATVFAINPESGLYTDIMAFNAEANCSDKKVVLILGEDENDYLIYNDVLKIYQVIDKQDELVWAKYDNWEAALSHLLKI